jgi:hypothetical protein
MGFRRLQFDPTSNDVTGLPEEFRTVRFRPNDLVFLDSAVANDRSRLVRAGTTLRRPLNGFSQTLADPSDSSVWSLNEVAGNSGLRASIVQRP